jgi:phi13 family phage major tail protein
MKKVGLKYPVCALYNDSTGSPVYSNGTVMGKAISAAIAWTKNNVPLYADDAADEWDQSITGGTVTYGLNELIHTIQSLILGHKINGSGELVVNELDIAPYVGFGFYGRVLRSGVSKYRAVWLKKVQFGEPNDDTNTQGATIAFQTPSIVGNIMKDIKGDFKEEKLLDTEADAIAYLNDKAGIPVSVSGGLTALAFTGTGGTLSPAFSTANRYYTFGGLTGNSFTVTATAVNHTIQLYDGDTLIQNLTSGVASAAISMSEVGTKKLRIVAQEAGKSSQTTEVIVVKTA